MTRFRNISFILIITFILHMISVPSLSLSLTAYAAGGPMVQSISPDTGTQVTSNREIVITFTEPVRRGTAGLIKLMDTNVTNMTLADYPIIDYTTIQWVANDKLSINAAALAPGKSFYIIIDAGALIGVNSGQPIAAYTSSTTYTYTVVQLLGPSLFPAIIDTNVDADSTIKLRLQFSQPMKIGKGLLYVKDFGSDSIIQSIDVNASSAVTIIDGGSIPASTVEIPIAKLSNSKKYYVMIDPGAFLDVNDNPYTGINDKSWHFTAEDVFDTIAPTATSFSPAKGGTWASQNSILSITFNEKVYAGTGSIIIKKMPGDVLVCSIPANYTGAVKLDTVPVTISTKEYSCPAFTNGVQYKVVMDDTVFRDATGNKFLGTTAASDAWTFTANVDTVPPTAVSYFPTVSAVDVPVTTPTLSMIFNEPIKITGAQSVVFPQNNPTLQNKLTMTVDTTDNRKLILTPESALKPGTKYSVTIPNGSVTDMSGNAFTGILNPYNWTFDTTALGTTPSLTKAEMEGTSLVLTYNETLDPTKVPFPDNFYVTVNDVSRKVTGVVVSGTQVRLTLQTGVLVGQIVKVSYFPDYYPSRHIQNFVPRDAAGLSNREVTNTADTTLPRPLNGTASVNTITLNFNKTLVNLGTNPQYQFSVNWGGQTVSPSSVSISGSTLILAMPNLSYMNGSISVSYSPGTAQLTDLAGNAVAAFSNFAVVNPYDTTPPTLTSGTAFGNKIILSFSEALRNAPLPLLSSFSVLVNGVGAVISSLNVNGNNLEITLSQSVTAAQQIALTYVPSSPSLTDLNGNLVAAIMAYPIVSQAPAKLNSASVQGSIVSLVFSNPINSSSMPAAAQFYVKAGGRFISASNVTVNGSQVLVSLVSLVESGQTASVTYLTGGTPLKDTAGQAVAAFSDYPLTNGSSGSLPPYLEADPEGGLRFNSQGVTASYSQSAGGRSVNRYMVDADKLTAGYTQLATMGSQGGIKTISVTVPSTEPAGVVNVPVRSFIDAQSRISDAAFRVNYGDYKFIFPLSAVNLIQEVSQLGGSVANASVQFNIEKANGSSNITSAISGRGLTMLAAPVDFTATLMAGNQQKELKDYSVYVKRAFVIPDSMAPNAKDLAVVRYDEQTHDIAYVPTQTVAGNGNITVWFKRKSNSVYAVVRKTPVTYPDMVKHWASGDVSLLASKFIVDGPTAISYAPNQNITRADFAKFIVKGLGLSGDSGAAAKFRDVSLTGAAAPYIGAAGKAGIVSGGTDGNFRPDANVTREEMASMIVKAMQVAGVQGSTSTGVLARFSDRSKISSFAMAPVAACVNAGIISGVTPTKFSPKDNATRAQAAAMLIRLLQHVEFLP